MQFNRLCAGFETCFGWDPWYQRCWEQNTSRIQMMRQFDLIFCLRLAMHFYFSRYANHECTSCSEEVCGEGKLLRMMTGNFEAMENVFCCKPRVVEGAGYHAVDEHGQLKKKGGLATGACTSGHRATTQPDTPSPSGVTILGPCEAADADRLVLCERCQDEPAVWVDPDKWQVCTECMPYCSICGDNHAVEANWEENFHVCAQCLEEDQAAADGHAQPDPRPSTSPYQGVPTPARAQLKPATVIQTSTHRNICFFHAVALVKGSPWETMDVAALLGYCCTIAAISSHTPPCAHA